MAFELQSIRHLELNFHKTGTPLVLVPASLLCELLLSDCGLLHNEWMRLDEEAAPDDSSLSRSEAA